MVQPVSMRSSMSRSGPVAAACATEVVGDGERRPQRAQPLGAVVAARAGAVGAEVAERAEVGQPADLCDPLAEAHYQNRPGARRQRHNAYRALVPVPRGEDFDCGPHELIRDRPVRSLVGEQRPTLVPQPTSVRRPRARPGSAVRSAGILPEAPEIPRSFIPGGHIRRGSTLTPGRNGRCRAASAPACGTCRSSGRPVQLSQRPQRAAPGSSSSRRRYSIRQASVTWSASVACCCGSAPEQPVGTALGRRPTAGRWPPSRPRCGAPRRRRRAP